MDTYVEQLMADYEAFEDTMRDIFKAMLAFDENKNSTLSRSELRRFLAEASLSDGIPAHTLDELFEEMFAQADRDKSGELDFQEFIVCYNNLVTHRERHHLPPMDVQSLVSKHLRQHQQHDDKAKPQANRPRARAAMKASPPPGGKAAAAAVELIGDQASVVALVEIFLASEPDAAGKVTQESLFKALRACGCLTGNAKALEGMSFRSLGVEDVVRLVHPDMGRARASQLIHNAKRYIKDCEARQRKRHCQLYHDIKDNRMQARVLIVFRDMTLTQKAGSRVN